jgi:hypothetical protein
MIGRLEQNQGRLFSSFCLEEVVPYDHQVRAIASVLDLSRSIASFRPTILHWPRLGVTIFAGGVETVSSGAAPRAVAAVRPPLGPRVRQLLPTTQRKFTGSPVRWRR